jgi:DNA-binding transcriptional MerR regulator
MPFKEPEIKKLYYSIGEVAELFGVNTSTIRFWEKEFDHIKPKKNKKGNRLFNETEIDKLKVIYHLVKERGYTLDGARKKLKDNPTEVEHTAEIVQRLNEIKGFLLDLKESL